MCEHRATCGGHSTAEQPSLRMPRVLNTHWIRGPNVTGGKYTGPSLKTQEHAQQLSCCDDHSEIHSVK